MTREGLAAVVRRLQATFLGRCVVAFLEVRGIDRALVIASQAFTALIPLVLLVAAIAPADQGDVVADAFIARFRLTGDTAASMHQLFAHSGDSATGVFSVLLLLFSGVSLTRRMQHLYEQTWRLPPRPGVRHTAHAGLALGALLVGIGLLYMARALVQPFPFPGFMVLAVSLGASFLLWTTVPWLLLDRRLEWRRLVPLGVLTATCTGLYGIASTVYMPRLFETYSQRYGLFGVTLALVGWFLCISVILVASATVAAEFDRAPEPWVRRLRARVPRPPSEPPATEPPATEPPATEPPAPAAPPLVR